MRMELNDRQAEKVQGGYIKYEHGMYIVYDNILDKMIAAFDAKDYEAAMKCDEMFNSPHEKDEPVPPPYKPAD